MAVTVKEIAPNTWLFDENGGINLYLIAGDSRAVLIDTGFDGGWLPDTVASLTDKPVMLVHSHAHGDHTGGDMLYGEAWMHPDEFSDLLGQPDHDKMFLHPLVDGDTIDLGGRVLEVIHVPGHSPGGIALLDKQTRFLFSGDTVMVQPVFLQNPNSSAEDFAASLEKLSARKADFDLIYPCHDVAPIGHDELADLLGAAKAALSGGAAEKIDLPLLTPEGEMLLHFEGYTHGKCAVITGDLNEKPF
jgi:glyoxylase-like metal-dependent hydrolase (beta-lactamase superfamily II)